MTNSNIFSQVKKYLRSQGFSVSGNSAIITNGDLLNQIQIQRSRLGPEFTLNIGICPLAVERAYELNEVDIDISCYPVSERIGILKNNLDTWYDNSTDIDMIKNDIDNHAMSLFKSVSCPGDLIGYIFDSNKFSFEFGMKKISIYLTCEHQKDYRAREIQSKLNETFDASWAETLNGFINALNACPRPAPR